MQGGQRICDEVVSLCLQRRQPETRARKLDLAVTTHKEYCLAFFHGIPHTALLCWLSHNLHVPSMSCVADEGLR